MVDIDDILASAIRRVWFEAGKPTRRADYYLEIEKARRIRAAIEREGLIIKYASSVSEAALSGDRTKDIKDIAEYS